MLKLGVERGQRIPFQLRYSEESGRGMVASRSIKKGEVVLVESPVVYGPKATSSGAGCCGCGVLLEDIRAVIFCNACSLHFCSTTCCQSSMHKLECTSMQQFNIQTSSMEKLNLLTMAIVVLRSLLLPDTAPANWARLRLLQDHLDTQKNSQIQLMNRKFLVPFLREIGFDEKLANDTEILRQMLLRLGDLMGLKAGLCSLLSQWQTQAVYQT